MTWLVAIASVVVLGSSAAAQMTHDRSKTSCTVPGLACATKATPTFAPAGTLWRGGGAGRRGLVASSRDLGRSSPERVAVNTEPLDLDGGPDARPKIVVDKDGRVFVALARFRDRQFNGEVLYTRS